MTEGRPSATLTSATEPAITDLRVDDEERSLTGHAYSAARDDATAPITHGKNSQSLADRITVGVFVALPIIAVLAAIPFAWGWGMSWVDVLLGATFFALTSHGITIGFHRYFTHGSFKANRPLKIALAIAGSLAIEGPLARWVADHRKHHAHSDSEGDPHSPWAYGDSTWGLTKGLWHAHIGWFFDVEQTPLERYVPDLIRDHDLVRITRLFPVWVATSLLLPPILGGLLTWSWQGAVTAFFWATLVRVGLVHHVTWSINSVCHVWGKRPFKSRDNSGNVAWLAILSGGESWHNLHHSDPTCARHGALKWQLDSSARIIELFEWFGWATDVRWPKQSRLAARRVTADAKVTPGTSDSNDKQVTEPVTERRQSAG